MRKSIDLGMRKIEYELERKPVKNINLRIKADRTVFVSAAEDVSEKIIDKFLLSKAEYICSALKYYEEIEKYSPKPKQYIDGETFKIFGREQRLIVREGKKNSVMSDEAYITLTVKNLSDFALKKKTIEETKKKKAKRNRPYSYSFRVSETEKETIERKIKLSGQSKTDYLIRALADKPIRGNKQLRYRK